MSSQQPPPMDAMTQAVPSGNPVKAISYSLDASLLGNISNISRLAQITHQQIVDHNATLSEYKEAYSTVVYRLQDAFKEIEILREREKGFEERLKRVTEDSAVACDAKNRELKTKNNDFLGLVLEQDGIITSLEEQVENLEAKLNAVDNCAQTKLVQDTAPPNTEDEKNPNPVIKSTGIPLDQLEKALKRAYEGDSEDHEPPKKTRRRRHVKKE